MFFSRIASFAALAGLSLLACAAPIESTDIAIRGENTLVSRCGCGNDLTEILVHLEAKVNLSLDILDGKHNPVAACNKIIVAVNAAVAAIAKLDIKVALLQVEIDACVTIIVRIFLGITAALSRYSILLILTICARIDLCLSLFIVAIVKVCPALLVGIKAGILAKFDVFVAVKFILTIAACGL